MKNKISMILFVAAVLTIAIVGGIWMNGKDEKLEKAKDEGTGTVSFIAEDGVIVTADLYLQKDGTAPFIILFHQAGYSRGEYIEIAPKLREMGFSCMAVDQRSGSAFRGVQNETHKSAIALNKTSGYTDAYPDMIAAINYVNEHFKPSALILWGSSYSASLSLILASKESDRVDAVLAFSPGEYFKFEGKRVEEYSMSIQQPVFITSAKSEERDWRAIGKSIVSKEKQFFLPEVRGVHGSSALLEQTEGNDSYWSAVKVFLEPFRK